MDSCFCTVRREQSIWIHASVPSGRKQSIWIHASVPSGRSNPFGFMHLYRQEGAIHLDSCFCTVRKEAIHLDSCFCTVRREQSIWIHASVPSGRNNPFGFMLLYRQEGTIHLDSCFCTVRKEQSIWIHSSVPSGESNPFGFIVL